jgi:hypothetical protein
MVVTRSSGGPGRGAYTQEWRGATVLESWKQQIGDGCLALAQDILADLHQTLHVDTGESVRQAFSDVSLEGTKRTIRAGTGTDWAVYEELGTSRRPGHYRIRAVMDRQAPKLIEFDDRTGAMRAVECREERRRAITTLTR